jgi:hypothetical protein
MEANNLSVDEIIVCLSELHNEQATLIEKQATLILQLREARVRKDQERPQQSNQRVVDRPFVNLSLCMRDPEGHRAVALRDAEITLQHAAIRARARQANVPAAVASPAAAATTMLRFLVGSRVKVTNAVESRCANDGQVVKPDLVGTVTRFTARCVYFKTNSGHKSWRAPENWKFCCDQVLLEGCGYHGTNGRCRLQTLQSTIYSSKCNIENKVDAKKLHVLTTGPKLLK